MHVNELNNVPFSIILQFYTTLRMEKLSTFFQQTYCILKKWMSLLVLNCATQKDKQILRLCY